MKMRYVLALASSIFVSSCSQPASPPAANRPAAIPSDAAKGETPDKLAEKQDHACLIEGTFNLMGQTIKSKDCMQADPNEDEAAFKASCEQLASTSAMMGGAPGKITYMEHCTRPAQGVCKNFLGGKRDAYYYARSAEDLSDLPSDCAKGGGNWSSGS